MLPFPSPFGFLFLQLPSFINSLPLCSCAIFLYCWALSPSDPETEQYGWKPTSKICFLFILSFLFTLMRGKPHWGVCYSKYLAIFSADLSPPPTVPPPKKKLHSIFSPYFLSVSGYWTWKGFNYDRRSGKWKERSQFNKKSIENWVEWEE